MKSNYRVLPVGEQCPLDELIDIAVAALQGVSCHLVRSIFGPVGDWLPPYSELSEYTIIDWWQPVRTLGYLAQVSVPAWSIVAPDSVRALLPTAIERLFWRPSEYIRRPDCFDELSSYPRENWFFINGILTDQTLAIQNAAMLSRLFYRPITVIHNPTRSFVVDLAEAVIGKSFTPDPDIEDWRTITEPAMKAGIAILHALCRSDIDRVVVIGHSQGTIIISNVVRAIGNALHKMSPSSRPPVAPSNGATILDEQIFNMLAKHLESPRALEDPIADMANLLAKLEIYTLANCADQMTYLIDCGTGNVPYMEHFANQNDVVARLGVLSPYSRAGGPIDIDGLVYERTGEDSWGHMCNLHYLFAIQDYLSKNSSNNPYSNAHGRRPRLYDYHRGQNPKPYITL